MIVLAPRGGLCNRLRTLLSVVGFPVPTTCRVLWARNEECYARFDELFEPLSVAHVSMEDCPWWAAVARRRNLHLPHLVRQLMGYEQYEDLRSPEVYLSLLELLRSHYGSDGRREGIASAKLFISSSTELRHYPREAYDLLRPLPVIAERIAALRNQFAAHTVGVHIRRTDHRASIAHSPDTAFLRAMDEEVRRDPTVRFFLATDDDALKQRLKERYPDRLITQPQTPPRNTLDGMRAAVIDLWCLAATQKLLGSYGSSFTDTAAEMGNVPLEVVKA